MSQAFSRNIHQSRLGSRVEKRACRSRVRKCMVSTTNSRAAAVGREDAANDCRNAMIMIIWPLLRANLGSETLKRRRP